jgi:hypothetical protein
MMSENVITKKETALEKDLITKIVVGLILMWAFGMAWGILMVKYGVVVV